MDYTLESHLEGDILVVRILGRLRTMAQGEQMVRRVLSMVQATGAGKLLFDVRGLTERLDLGDMFFHVRQTPRLERYVCRAVLESRDQLDYAKFFEITSANVGQQVTMFFDEDEAMSWLREQRGPQATMPWQRQQRLG